MEPNEHPQQPEQPADPAAVPTPPPQQQKNKIPPTWALLTVAAALALCGVGGIAAAVTSTGDDETTVNRTDEPAVPAFDQPDDEPDEPKDEPDEPDEPPYTPKPDDFELSVKTLEKSCFGSAGCSITYRIELSYDGVPLNDDYTWELTYEMKGAEDPRINTLRVSGEEYWVDEEEFASTASSSDELEAVVTDVSEF